MRRINLSPPEQAALESTFKTASDRRLRDRCQAVLMASRGRKRTEIAQDLGVHRRTVILWLKRYHKRGLGGLQIQWAPGKTRRIPEELAPTIQEWVKKGPPSCGLDRANWTYEELAVHLYQQTGIDVKRSAMQDFCQYHQIRLYRPTYCYLRGDPDKQLRGDPDKQQTAREEIAALKKAELGQGVLLSQDEARFPLTPTLRATLGVKGHRPMVGTWDNKDLVYCYAALNVTSGKLTTRLLEQPARIKRQTGQSKTRRLQVAFVAHLHDIARAYPAESHPDVVIIIDNAPWHQGPIVEEAMAAHRHLTFYRLPSYSPQLNPIERFWRILRRRATHNRLFTTRSELRQTLRHNLCYYQSMRHKVLSLLESKRKKAKT